MRHESPSRDQTTCYASVGVVTHPAGLTFTFPSNPTSSTPRAQTRSHRWYIRDTCTKKIICLATVVLEC